MTCHRCGETRHHSPSCPEMFWPDGRPRGMDPGRPPAESMTLQDELAGIFAGTTERMIADHIAREKARHEASE